MRLELHLFACPCWYAITSRPTSSSHRDADPQLHQQDTRPLLLDEFAISRLCNFDNLQELILMFEHLENSRVCSCGAT